MRTIKFRAWCEGKHENMTFTEAHMDYEVTIKNGMYADVESGWDIHGTYPTIPIMQFTGLKDKNGKEIYEGDILKGTNDVYINGFNTPVEFHKGSFNTVIQYDMHHVPLFDYETVWMKKGFKGDTDTCLWISEFEIIGNIHQNNELLK